jgi:hypothetical protein
MGNSPTLRRCIYALAALSLLYATLFVGIENPTTLRAMVAVGAFFLGFPADQFLRLTHLLRDKRAEPKDFLFTAALDPAEGHFEPDDYTLIGVITGISKLNSDDDD